MQSLLIRFGCSSGTIFFFFVRVFLGETIGPIVVIVLLVLVVLSSLSVELSEVDLVLLNESLVVEERGVGCEGFS